MIFQLKGNGIVEGKISFRKYIAGSDTETFQDPRSVKLSWLLLLRKWLNANLSVWCPFFELK